MNGEIFFNMFKEPHPIVGHSEYMLKRWRKYTIYAKSGSYVRSDNPSEVSIHSSSVRSLTKSSTYTIPDSPKANVYSTNSIYLYDYVLVSDHWMFTNVYTSSVIDSTPSGYYAGMINGTASYYHTSNTWLNSPNAICNNYLLGPIYRDDGTYFEIIRGYPRNHYTHKRNKFSLERFMSYGLTGNVMAGRTVTSASYRKGMQTAGTTISLDGLGDGSDPIQSTQVTNIDLIQSDNVIFH